MHEALPVWHLILLFLSLSQTHTQTHTYCYLSLSCNLCIYAELHEIFYFNLFFYIFDPLDIHSLACMCLCMPFSSDVYQKQAHPSIILTVTSESTTQGALMIEVCILYHPLNKSSDLAL